MIHKGHLSRINELGQSTTQTVRDKNVWFEEAFLPPVSRLILTGVHITAPSKIHIQLLSGT